MNTTNKEIKEKEERLLSFKKEVEGLHDITDAEEYARQLAHLFLGNGLSLQTILLMAIDFGQQHPHWIPVEEEQPKASGDYIICEKRGLVREAHYFKLEDLWLFHGGALASPTHWIPLPTPPRKEDKK